MLPTHGGGAFIEQCLEHVVANSWGWEEYETGGAILMDAVTRWWDSIEAGGSDPTQQHTYLPDCVLQHSNESAAVQCNPSCFFANPQ